MKDDQKKQMAPTQEAILAGTTLMLVQSPLTNAFNGVSVFASRYHLSWAAPYLAIYHGLYTNDNTSVYNFTRGLGAHLTKESLRLLYRPITLHQFKPWLEQQNMHPVWATFLFASILSIADMAILNPADAIRVQRQATKRVEYTPTALYRGALANGTKQFILWSKFSLISHLIDQYLIKNGIDKTSLPAVFIKGATIASTTLATFPIENIKNAKLFAAADRAPSYPNIVRNLYARGGSVAFYRGIGPKMLASLVQSTGASAVIALGNKRRANNSTHQPTR